MSANAEGRFWFFFLVALFAYVAGTLSAEAGTITAGGYTFEVIDTSCSAVRAGAQRMAGSSAVYAIGCTVDPVVVGSTIGWFYFSSGAGLGGSTWVVTAVNASAPSSGSSGGVSQSSFDLLQATVTALQTAVAALQSSASGSSQPFDYVMAGVVFSFFFSFTVGVWVVSKNMGLILNAIRRW